MSPLAMVARMRQITFASLPHAGFSKASSDNAKLLTQVQLVLKLRSVLPHHVFHNPAGWS